MNTELFTKNIYSEIITLFDLFYFHTETDITQKNVSRTESKIPFDALNFHFVYNPILLDKVYILIKASFRTLVPEL